MWIFLRPVPIEIGSMIISAHFLVGIGLLLSGGKLVPLFCTKGEIIWLWIFPFYEQRIFCIWVSPSCTSCLHRTRDIQGWCAAIRFYLIFMTAWLRLSAALSVSISCRELQAQFSTLEADTYRRRKFKSLAGGKIVVSTYTKSCMRWLTLRVVWSLFRSAGIMVKCLPFVIISRIYLKTENRCLLCTFLV